MIAGAGFDYDGEPMPLDQPKSAAHSFGDELRMTFGEHIEELRGCLIRALIGVAVALAVTLYFGFDLIGWIAQPLLQAQYALGYPPQTIATDPTVGFTNVYLPVSLIGALILASPWVIYQLWRFVVAGLYEHERKTVYILAPFSTLMTVLGVCFAYYVLLPVSLLFFLSFAAYYPPIEPTDPGPVMRQLLRAYGVDHAPSEGVTLSPPDAPIPTFPTLAVDPPEPVEGMVWINAADGHLKTYFNGQTRLLLAAANRLISPLPQLGQFIKFAALTTLGIVIAFQVPVVMLVIGWTNLVDPRWVGRFRKYAFFACAALGAVLTPTDIFSMFVLAVPLYALFEFGLLLMRMTHKPAPEEL